MASKVGAQTAERRRVDRSRRGNTATPLPRDAAAASPPNGGTTTLGNTIVAGNTGQTTHVPRCQQRRLCWSQGSNLIGEIDGSSGWVGSDLTGTVATPLNAMLAPLANNGGPTQTMALLPGSLAIDAGNNALIPGGVTTDQRGTGNPRIVNGSVDIGAFEFQGTGTGESQSISFSACSPTKPTGRPR